MQQQDWKLKFFLLWI